MERKCRLWLMSIAKIRRTAISRLLNLYGSAEAISELSDDEINAVKFLKDEEKERLRLREVGLASDYLKYIGSNDTRFIIPGDEEYPITLMSIEDAPQGLFCRGKFIDLNENVQIAMVGARKCTQYGYECAKTIARGIAKEGVIVVSGMAMGIDSAAHEGALEANMPTVAVLGCGVNVIYPASSRSLMNRIMATGMVISEYPVNTEPTRYTFPERNRIISGISHGLAVIEATSRSGSLITARCAAEQGKDLFAVPGNINNTSASGTNQLIKDGAHLITCAKDITLHYEDRLAMTRSKFAQEETVKKNETEATGIEAEIANALTSEPQSMEELAQRIPYSASEISTALLMMELTGKVMTYPGGKYSKPIIA